MTAAYLNFIGSAFNILSVVFIVLAIINIRRATKSLQEWSANLRAASVGRNPTGEDRADGLRRNDEHAVAATGGETPDPSSTNPGADNGRS